MNGHRIRLASLLAVAALGAGACGSTQADQAKDSSVGQDAQKQADKVRNSAAGKDAQQQADDLRKRGDELRKKAEQIAKDVQSGKIDPAEATKRLTGDARSLAEQARRTATTAIEDAKSDPELSAQAKKAFDEAKKRLDSVTTP